MRKYIVAIVLILFFPIFLSLPIYNDNGAYAYMGTLFFEGKLPYIDGWDHKGISMYLINALGYLIGFKHLMGIRLLEFLLILGSFFSIFKTLSQKYTQKIAFVAVSFGLLSLRYFFDGGNMTEEYGALFALISLSLILKEKIRTMDYIFIGILFVVNITIRANLISFWIALFLAMIIYAILKKELLKKVIFPFSKMLIGIGISASLLTIYFLMTASFLEFYNAAFTYNFSYAKRSFLQTIGSVITSTRRYEVSLVMLLGFLIAMVSLVKKRTNFVSLLLFFWVPLELYFGNMSGKLFAHYYMMWIPIIVLSTAYIIDYFKIETLQREKKFVILGIITFLFFQIPIFSTVKSYKQVFLSKRTQKGSVVSHINKNYKNASILIWGNSHSTYLLVDKRAVVPYFFQTFFKVKSDITKNIMLDFTKRFIQNPPDLLVDAKTPSLLFLDNSNSDEINNYQKENLQEYFSFVHQNYKLKETIKGVDFYIKK